MLWKIVHSLHSQNSSARSAVGRRTARRRALQVGVALTHLGLGFVAETFNAISSIQSSPNLFVSLYKAFKFAVKFDILAGKYVAVVLECVNFGAHIRILTPQALRLEAQVFLFSALRTQLVVSASYTRLQIVQVGGHVPIASQLVFTSAHQVTLLSHFNVNGAGQLAGFVVQTRKFVSLTVKVTVGRIVGFCGSS